MVVDKLPPWSPIDGSVLTHAALGSVVSVVLVSGGPYMSAVGGAVGAYLHGGDRDAGKTIGLLAGLIASVVISLVQVPAFVFLVLVYGLSFEAIVLLTVILGPFLLFLHVVQIVSSVLGGRLGSDSANRNSSRPPAEMATEQK